MNCPACSSVHTMVDLDEEMKPINSCVECDHRWRAGAAPVVTDDFPAAPAPKAIAAPIPVVAEKKPVPVTDRNIVKLARSRIRELTKEINKLTALKRERDELKRLVAAAKQRGATDNVRRIRSAS